MFIGTLRTLANVLLIKLGFDCAYKLFNANEIAQSFMWVFFILYFLMLINGDNNTLKVRKKKKKVNKSVYSDSLNFRN